MKKKKRNSIYCKANHFPVNNFQKIVTDKKNADTIKLLLFFNKNLVTEIDSILERTQKPIDIIPHIFLSQGIQVIKDEPGITKKLTTDIQYWNELLKQKTLSGKTGQIRKYKREDENRLSQYKYKPDHTFLQARGIRAKAVFNYFKKIDDDIEKSKLYRLTAEIIHISENVTFIDTKENQDKLRKNRKELKKKLPGFKDSDLKDDAPYKPLTKTELDELQKEIKNQIEQLPA